MGKIILKSFGGSEKEIEVKDGIAIGDLLRQNGFGHLIDRGFSAVFVNGHNTDHLKDRLNTKVSSGEIIVVGRFTVGG